MKWTPAIIAMLVIGALEAYALYQGINGALLSGTVAIIAGLGGFTAGRISKPQ